MEDGATAGNEVDMHRHRRVAAPIPDQKKCGSNLLNYLESMTYEKFNPATVGENIDSRELVRKILWTWELGAWASRKFFGISDDISVGTENSRIRLAKPCAGRT